jgi:hypothetical protein
VKRRAIGHPVNQLFPMSQNCGAYSFQKQAVLRIAYKQSIEKAEGRGVEKICVSSEVLDAEASDGCWELTERGRRWGVGRKGGGPPVMGSKEGKGISLPQLPSPLVCLKLGLKKACTNCYVVTEGLRSKLRDKGSGGTSRIFGGLFTHLRHLKKLSSFRAVVKGPIPNASDDELNVANLRT